MSEPIYNSGYDHDAGNGIYQDYIIVERIDTTNVIGKLVYVVPTKQVVDDPFAPNGSYEELFRREVIFVADRAEQVGPDKTKIYIKKTANQSAASAIANKVEFKGIEDYIPSLTGTRKTEVVIFDPVKDITMDGINVEFSNQEYDKYNAVGTGSPDPLDIEEIRKAKGEPWNGLQVAATTISVNGAYNLSLKNMTIKDSLSVAIELRNSVGANVNNITIDGAYNKNTGGAGYGLALAGSNSNVFTDMIIKNMRHSVLFSSVGNEYYNYIGIKDTNVDINFHGSLDRHNMIDVLKSEIRDLHLWSGEEYYERARGDGTPIKTYYNKSDQVLRPDEVRVLYEKYNAVTFGDFKGGNASDNIRASQYGANPDGGGGRLDGGGGGDSLFGNIGNDLLIGGSGQDNLYGETGNDTYVVDNAGDVVFERVSSGFDKILSSVSYALAAGQEVEQLQLLLSTATQDLDLTGNEFNNTLYGNHGDNVLAGLGAADVLYGRNGNDTLDGGLGIDRLYGENGNDTYIVDNAGDAVFENAAAGFDKVLSSVSYTLAAGQEVEQLQLLLSTTTQDLNLTGNEFNNTLYGNHGDNVLIGLGGNDILLGKNGNDSFVFNAALGAGNVDQIQDFATDVDTIVLVRSHFSALSLGAMTADRFKDISAGSLDASDRILYKSSTGELFYDLDGNGSGAASLFATLVGKSIVKYSDFEVI